MFISTQNEIKSLMPTARWDRPDELKGYLEEEEMKALEPLLGTELYQHLCTEYERLREQYGDITATTIKPTGKARQNPEVPYADVTERMDSIQDGKMANCICDCMPEEETDVPDRDMQTVRLIRRCQRIEFYNMVSHKAWLLSVSFNDGGGMNMVSAEGYEPANNERIEKMSKDAFMSAGRAVDDLLLFLEADAKGKRIFTELWKKADAFYLHKDLLFQTAHVLNEFLDIRNDRMIYVQLVRDIRFCQNTYLKPRIGSKLLKALIEYANDADEAIDVYDELIELLRTALAFYVESRRQETGMTDKNAQKLARRDSMSDAQQAMATACQYVYDNLDGLGDVAKDSPEWKKREEDRAKKASIENNASAAAEQRRRKMLAQGRKKLFTVFPATHRNTDVK